MTNDDDRYKTIQCVQTRKQPTLDGYGSHSVHTIVPSPVKDAVRGAPYASHFALVHIKHGMQYPASVRWQSQPMYRLTQLIGQVRMAPFFGEFAPMARMSDTGAYGNRETRAVHQPRLPGLYRLGFHAVASLLPDTAGHRYP